MSKNTDSNEQFKKVLCPECMGLQEFEIKCKRETRKINGIDYSFNKRIGFCKKCGAQVLVPGLEDENEEAFEFIFREQNGYIQKDDIRKVLEKYDIEKRPLSKALGMGEHTIEQYLEGQLPNKAYSDRLIRVLNSYMEMYKYFDENKSKLTDKAIQKIERRLDYYRVINSTDTEIEKVALYILNSKYEITNMSLQKLLYYIEGFIGVALNEQLYSNRCEAWMYGPVYPEIYEKYKVFGGNQITVDKMNFDGVLDKKYRQVIDFVLNHFAIFNGTTLRDLSHAEKPWRDAHLGYYDTERCEEEITHESIVDYFSSMNKKFNLMSEEGIKKYIDSLNVI